MDFTRNLRQGMRGEDVMEAKQRLLALGYYAEHITTVTRSTFGADTREAVIRFQAQAGLSADGVIGAQTWETLFFGASPAEQPTDEERIGSEPQAALPIVKAEPSDKAKAVCALALTRIGDVYVWSDSGNSDLSDAHIRKEDGEADRAIKFRDAQFKAGLTGLLSHDCSGFISWLYREAGVWDKRRDCDVLWGYCTEIKRAELIPGDLLFRHETGNPGNKTHVGLYLGSGKVIHCKGREAGVVHEGINKGGSGYWHVCGRPKLLY